MTLSLTTGMSELTLDARDEEVHPEAAVAPGFLTTHAAQVFNRRADEALRTHGLSLALLAPLLLIHWKGPMLQRDLVRHSAVRQPAMVAVLGKLEHLQLVKRAAVATDRRAALIELTAAGRDAASLGGDILRRLNQAGLDGFSDGEIALLVGLVRRFSDNLLKAPATKYQR